MRAYFRKLLSIAIFLSLYGIIWAQTPVADEESGTTPPEFDFKNEKNILSMRSDNLFIPGYGILLNSYNIYDRENDLNTFSARPWLQLNTGSNSRLYFRIRNNYAKFLKKDEYIEKDSENIFDLDLGYYSLERSRFQVRLGRQFVQLGQGLLLDSRADGVTGNLNFPLLRVNILSVYSGFLQKDYNPFNLSDRDFSEGAKRLFNSLSLGFTVYGHLLEVIFLNEKDFAKEKDGLQFAYDVNYTGMSATGRIWGNFHYALEGYLEFGTSHVDGTPQKKSVLAFGEVGKIYYFLSSAIVPKIFFEYAYGSGDAQRNAASSPIGNQSGSDSGFIHFGTFQAGLGLRPMLANIQILDIGANITPLGFSKNMYLRDMQLSTRFLRYWKIKSSGGINSGEALYDSHNIGYGIDVFWGWRLSAEFSLVSAYGYFKEGGAYGGEKKVRNLFLIGINLSI